MLKTQNMRYIIIFISVMAICCNITFAQQDKDPWDESQLIRPAILASKINQNSTNNLVIISVGPDNLIKGSVDIGPAQEQTNQKKLKNYLSNIPKDQDVVIYCGCCPFDKCPNIRPAFKILTDMRFEKPMLLNLSKNIKVNWLDKNYPTND